jgi:molybdopterin molybdotransferase
MISFEKALHIIGQAAESEPLKEKVVLADAAGRILAEDIFSDMDMPPFDKAAVDGYACRQADLARALTVVEIVPAGKMPTQQISQGQCAKVMTGGVVPTGADMVIMVEDVEEIAGDKIRFARSKSNTNICYKGEDIRKADSVLEKGSLIRPQEIAVLASVGCTEPAVYQRPVVGVISTGDELVEPSEVPAESQIRNSNAAQLMAQAAALGAVPKYFGIAKDTEASTYEKIHDGLTNCDVVLLSGGVSMGDFDYVPKVLTDLGVSILFKSVAIQPGRPTVFGTSEKKYLFGLPGNPVSSFVIFELLVKPLLNKLSGSTSEKLIFPLKMGQAYHRRKAVRKSFLPVKIKNGEVFPVEYHGSAHINAYVFADGIVSVDIGTTVLEKGQQVWFMPVS